MSHSINEVTDPGRFRFDRHDQEEVIDPELNVIFRVCSVLHLTKMAEEELVGEDQNDLIHCLTHTW